ncbi:MAG: OsmC family protein [Rhodothermales bacterium]|nr:OsmC family protein [Rhodothermales bacterium]
MIHIQVERVDDAFHFVGRNDRGNTVHMDTSVEDGGSGQGAGPMQTLLMALGGCSGIDIVAILKKGRQEISSFKVDFDAERAQGEIPSLYTRIHAHFSLEGDLDPEKVRRAIELSLDKYCSVAKTLEKTATITYSFSVNAVDYV